MFVRRQGRVLQPVETCWDCPLEWLECLVWGEWTLKCKYSVEREAIQNPNGLLQCPMFDDLDQQKSPIFVGFSLTIQLLGGTPCPWPATWWPPSCGHSDRWGPETRPVPWGDRGLGEEFSRCKLNAINGNIFRIVWFIRYYWKNRIWHTYIHTTILNVYKCTSWNDESTPWNWGFIKAQVLESAG